MATMRNPLNTQTYIDLLPVIENIVPSYGLIADSGLFRETAVKSNVAIYEVQEQVNTKMTKLTSRTERDAVGVARGRSKHVTIGGQTIKLHGSVHVEDLQNVLTNFSIEEDVSLQQAIADRTADLYNSWSQSYEYMLLTASQGKMRDPLDGTVVIDQFTNTGTVQSTATIDLRTASTSVISDINALRNQLNQLNGYQGNITEVEVWVAEDVFNALISHPELVDLATLAYSGMGAAAFNNPLINGSASRPTLNRYGWSREFRWENMVFRTYPQQFVRMDGTAVSAVANGKGWTVARGAINAYEVLFAPAPYFSQLNGLGQKVYARSTGVVDDTHVDITMETHLTPFLKRPELAIDITFTLA